MKNKVSLKIKREYIAYLFSDLKGHLLRVMGFCQFQRLTQEALLQ